MSSVPTLQSMSAAKIAIVICTNASVKKELFHDPKSNDKWFDSDSGTLRRKGSYDGVTKRTVENLLKDVPVSCSALEILSFHIHSVVPNAWQWLRYLNLRFDIGHDTCVELLKASLFISSGRLDRQAAAREMVQNESLDISKRLDLACLFLPLEDVSQLWWQMDKKLRKKYVEDLRRSWKLSPMAEQICHLAVKTHKPVANRFDAYCTDEFWKEVLEKVVDEGSDVAVKYYWPKLSASTRHQTALKTFCRLVLKGRPLARYDSFLEVYKTKCFVEILLFLLSEMEEHQKVSILQEDVEWCGEPSVLNSLLECHCEVGFLDMARLSWSVLRESALKPVLIDLAWDIPFASPYLPEFDYTSFFDIQRILREFWEQSPSTFKRAAFKDATIFRVLGEQAEVNITTFLLKDATLEEKVAIMFSCEPCLMSLAFENSDRKLANEWLDGVCSSRTEKREFLLKGFNDSLSSHSARWIFGELTDFYSVVDFCLQFEDESTKANLRKAVACKKGNDIVVWLLESDKVEQVDSFLQWCFSTPEEITDFKRVFGKIQSELSSQVDIVGIQE